MNPFEIIAYVVLGLGLVKLYQIFGLLERILDILLRSLPLDAVALLPAADESPDPPQENRPAIQAFRQIAPDPPTSLTDFRSEHEASV